MEGHSQQQVMPGSGGARRGTHDTPINRKHRLHGPLGPGVNAMHKTLSLTTLLILLEFFTCFIKIGKAHPVHAPPCSAPHGLHSAGLCKINSLVTEQPYTFTLLVVPVVGGAFVAGR